MKRLIEAAKETADQDLKLKEQTIKKPADQDLEQKDGESMNSSSFYFKDSSMHLFTPTDLLGRTFLMDEREDGQRQRAKIIEIVEAVEDQERDLERDKERIKCKVKIGNKYEDILSFNQVIDYIERRENNEPDPQWNFRKITAHQGPLRQSDPDYLGSQWNFMIQSETGEVTQLPLAILAAEDPVLCAEYASNNNLLELPGWQQFKRNSCVK